MDKFETWGIKRNSKSYCWWLDFDWCDHQKKLCNFDICPFKVKDSHKFVDTYGKTLEKIDDKT